MAIVGMSGKNVKRDKPIKKIIPVEKEIRSDTTWYNPSLCKKCPYLEMDDVAQMARCHKPYTEDCLGESMLVQQMLLREHYLKITKQLDEIDAKATEGLRDCKKVQSSQKPFVSRRKLPLKRRR